MEQRRLRLGDILDDYCPRERRVTNHAVVAMIEILIASVVLILLFSRESNAFLTGVKK